MISLFFSAVLTFLATEMDDFALFVILFARYKNSKAAVFWGHMLMMILVTVLCSFVSIPLSKIPAEYLRWLGVIPFALGVIKIFKKEEDDEVKQFAAGVFVTSLLITLTASGDNIGVYIPVFTALTAAEKILTLCTFVILQCVWSGLQIKTAQIPAIGRFVEKTSKYLIPAVLIVLGIVIFITTGK